MVTLAEAVERPNRFLLRARLGDGSVTEAHLPNTGRLEELLRPGSVVVLRPENGAQRRTRWTAVRVLDGAVWVSLEASAAPRLLARWVRDRRLLGPFRPVVAVHTEVSRHRHRFDLVADLADGRSVWAEVKSSTRAREATALLSRTPSVRGRAHLSALAEIVAAGDPAAVVFVVQRPDADRLLVGGDADPGWIAAVTGARDAGVTVLAYRCRVTPETVAVDAEIPVDW